MTTRPKASELAIGLSLAVVSALARSRAQPTLVAADDVLQRSRAMYAELRSYADTGVVIHEYGASSTDEFKFVTRFNRSPRRFYLEYSSGQFVIWGDPDAFRTWTKVTGD